MTPLKSLPAHAVAVAGYVLVSLVFTWPLVLHLGSHLPGSPQGDTGVYLWNIWVFRHEASLGHFPLFTDAVFSLDPPANLALHNYTVFADLVAYPLLPLLGVVRTFNVLHIGLFVLNGWAMFALARRLAREWTLAWLAGLLFAFSPTLVARSTAHASLLAAAPLPLFVLCLLNLERERRARWAVGAGATMAWAALSDPYYGIYCAFLAAWHVTTRVLAVRIERTAADTWWGARVLEVVVASLSALTAVIVVSGGFTVQAGGLVIGLRTAYTPVLLLTLAVLARLALAYRPHIVFRPMSEWAYLFRTAPYAAATATILLAPVLYAFVLRVMQGRYVTAPVYWRTSMPGVDLLSLLGPNPNLAWLAGWRGWLAGQSGGFEENVASVTISALAVVAVALAASRFRPPAYWAGLAVLAGSVTLGPFVHVAGANTCVPTAWTVLRYAPVLGAARAPARFAVLLMVAIAVLFALALKALLERYPSRRGPILACVGAALAFELFPAPRPLHTAAVPAFYERVAADRRDVRLLELPFGVRDGLSSFGNFSASTQYFQTRHGKRLIGGYLSRVSAKRVNTIRQRPILAAFMALSEGGTISEADVQRLTARGPAFVRRAHLGYVVIDRTRASRELADCAVRILSLEKIDEAGARELYRPRFLAGAEVEAASHDPTTSASQQAR